MKTDRERSAARLSARLDSGEVRCAVIGLGFIGTTLMDALRAKGVETHGIDRDPRAVRRYREREAALPANGEWSAGEDPAVVSAADVVFVAVRAMVGERTTELEPLRSAAAILERHTDSRERLVLLESTVPPGTTRRFARWCDETATGESFVAHCPERLSVGDDWRTLEGLPHLVGGVDSESTRLAARFVGRICREVHAVSSAEVSELSKLLENTFLTVGIGLIGEITRLAHALGISARDVTEAAATKPRGYLAFHPGPGVGGHCLPNDLRMLRQVADDLGKSSDLLDATSRVLAALPAQVVDRLATLLAARGSSLGQADVLLVGVGFKIGSADTTLSPTFDVVRRLRERGARPCYLDGLVSACDVDGVPVERVERGGLLDRRLDAVVLLAGDPSLTTDELEATGAAILDAGGGVSLPRAPDGVCLL